MHYTPPRMRLPNVQAAPAPIGDGHPHIAMPWLSGVSMYPMGTGATKPTVRNAMAAGACGAPHAI